MRLEQNLLALLLALLAQILVPAVSAQQNPVTVTELLKASESWNGAPVRYPEGTPEITALVIEIAPGAQTGWHAHPVPSFAMLLAGELEVELEDGRRNVLKAGDGIVEVVDTLHNGTNKGTEPVKLVVFYAGVKEQPLTLTGGPAPPGE